MNPPIDVGQVEGALIMGLGYLLHEREVLDAKTGRTLTNSTWVLSDKLLFIYKQHQILIFPKVLDA